MNKQRSPLHLVILLLATSLPCMWLAWRFMAPTEPSVKERSVTLKLEMAGFKDRVELLQNNDGTYSFMFQRGSGDEEVLSPQELAERLYRQEQSRDWVSRLLNISTPLGMVWVGIGLLGQLLFTGRMVIQWLASERSRRSVVPPMFWWFSLVGALMLLVYFMWRRDIVGVLGQSFGLGIYFRNLYFIYAVQRVTRPDKDQVIH